MSPRQISPYLGGPRARLAQLLLLLLHLALIVALVWMAVLFAGLQERFLFEPWQEIVFWGLVIICFVGFSWRTIRIGRDLLGALRSRQDPPATED